MKWFSTLLLMCLCGCLYSQSDHRFIEFSVSDSVKIVPDKINYRVAIYANRGFDMNGFDDSANEYKLKETEERFIKLCNKLNLYPVRSQENSKYKIMPYEGGTTQYTLEFKSEKEIQKLYEQIKEIEGISGFVFDNVASAQRQEAARHKLLERLRVKANAEAALLAKAFNKSAGSLLSISIEPANFGYSLYPGLAEVNYYQDYREEPLYFTIYMTAKFKFELN